MNVYIDAMFSIRDEKTKGVRLFSDNMMVMDTAPFNLRPECALLSVGDGKSAGEFFVSAEDGGNVAERTGVVIGELEKEYGSVTLVGWYLDQVVIPALCADAVIAGKPLHPWLMRKLDDKWSKPAGVSLDRAFYQGWYPFSREFSYINDKPKPLTVEGAYELCGLGKFKDLVGYWTVATEEWNKEVQTAKPTDSRAKGVLTARCEAMKAIHERHDSIAYGRKVS